MPATQFEIRPLAGMSAAACGQAVALYWQAFGSKLGRLLGPERQAMALLANVVQPDHALVAIESGLGAVVAVAGFRSPRGSFVPLTGAPLRAVYGNFGGWARQGAIALLSREVDNTRFLVDGIAVSEAWRSKGIGAALVAALTDEARCRGYDLLRLDVSDQNPRARSFYERLGFVPAGHRRAGIMAPVLGITGSTTMVRPI